MISKAKSGKKSNACRSSGQSVDEERLGKMQGEYRPDVLKFGNSAPAGMEKVKGKWDELFAEADITYDVDINIDNFGSSGRKR